MLRYAPFATGVAVLLSSLLPAVASAESVHVRGVVFGADGLPAPGISVRLDEQTITTDQDGAFSFEAAPGKHTLEVAGGTLVVAGATEVLVNLTASGAPTFDVEGHELVADTIEPVAEEVVVGTVRGRLVDLEGKPIAGVQVFVRGSDTEVRTTADGSFTLELPVGEQGLAFVHADYSSQDKVVEVSADHVEALEVALTPAAVALDDYTVTAPRIEGSTVDLLAERKDSSSVTEVIGAEEMSRTGASSAADAVTRVTGITVVGGKYVFVRGLGDRYSSTLLNGASLPSPEPEKRVVPLDLFPTDLLESVLVQKSFSPDMPGEFGGGVVVLRTREFPQQFEAQLGLSLGMTPGTTFQKGMGGNAGKLDWLGFDDGTRRMPAELREASEDKPLKEGDLFGSGGYTAAELERFGEMLPNRWALGERTVLPALGLKGSIGDGFSLLGKRAGYRVGLTYDHDSDRELRQQNYYVVGAAGQLERSNSYEFATTTDNVVLGGILTAGLELSEDNKITLTSLVDRVSDLESRVYEGTNRDLGSEIRVTRQRWLERQLLFEQLKGEHKLESGIGVDWHYVFAQARRAEPDRLETRYDLRPSGQYQLSDRPEGNSRVFSTLLDNAHDLSGEVALPFRLGSIVPTLSLGASGVLKDRGVDTRRFKYFGDSLDADLLSNAPEDLFVPDNIGPGKLQLLEVTRPTDNYSARQRVAAGWVDTSWPLLKSLEAGVGARLEYSSQRVETFELFNANAAPVEATLKTIDVLPAAFVAYSISERMKLRLAGSRTVSRPDFRELSPMLFNDVTGGLAVQGNPDLERALLTHVDTRWEWYPSETESLSVGVFYKHFHKPIESIIVPGAQQLKTFANAQGARNLGVEVEARKSFGFVAQALEDFYVSSNVSLIDSKIRLDPSSGVQTSSERALQGQSPWVVNAQLSWEGVDTGTSVAVLFNIVGPRISEVGAQGAPDIFEQAVPHLDFVASQKLGDRLKLGLKAKNLLDPEVRFTQGEGVVSSVRTGREFSLSLGASF